MRHLQRLWEDETGAIASTDLVLICTILVIGCLVGLTSLRDQVVQEFGDMAASFGALNQSYSFAGAAFTINGSVSTIAGSQFIDLNDSCDTGESGMGDSSGVPAVCISVSAGASHEQ